MFGQVTEALEKLQSILAGAVGMVNAIRAVSGISCLLHRAKTVGMDFSLAMEVLNAAMEDVAKRSLAYAQGQQPLPPIVSDWTDEFNGLWLRAQNKALLQGSAGSLVVKQDPRWSSLPKAKTKSGDGAAGGGGGGNSGHGGGGGCGGNGSNGGRGGGGGSSGSGGRNGGNRNGGGGNNSEGGKKTADGGKSNSGGIAGGGGGGDAPRCMQLCDFIKDSEHNGSYNDMRCPHLYRDGSCRFLHPMLPDCTGHGRGYPQPMDAREWRVVRDRCAQDFDWKEEQTKDAWGRWDSKGKPSWRFFMRDAGSGEKERN